jgi:hypothetical protein
MQARNITVATNFLETNVMDINKICISFHQRTSAGNIECFSSVRLRSVVLVTVH